MENMTMRIAIAFPALPAAFASSRALVPACATSADHRTADVRMLARAASLQGTGVSIAATVRDRATTGTTRKGQTGLVAGYVPGSLAWSPPI